MFVECWKLVTFKEISKKACDSGFSNTAEFTLTRGQEGTHFIVLFGNH